jgi:hypothetical protein
VNEIGTNRKELRIRDVANLQNVSAHSLVAEYGYKAIKGKTSTRVNSCPNLVHFGKGEFVASFLFDRKGLRRVVLVPIVPRTKAVNFPTKEYQDAKFEYCVSVLRDLCGKESATDSLGAYWKKGNITIGCTVILHGKDRYGGGDIFIDYQAERRG